MIFKIVKYSIISLICLLLAFPLIADVPVAVLPIKGSGDDCRSLETRIKQKIVELGGISIVADNMLKQIMEIQEKAQALGSAYHDISKLKTAEYIISGSVTNGKAQLSAVEINSGVEIYNRSFDYQRTNTYSSDREIRELRDAISIKAYSKGRDLPAGAGPYMQLLKNFVSSLGMDNSASYPFIAFYSKGKYSHPSSGNKNLVRQAKLFLRVVKPKIIRSRLIFNGIMAKAPWVHVYVVADKFGAKTKHKFDIMDLPDGTLGIVQYHPE